MQKDMTVKPDPCGLEHYEKVLSKQNTGEFEGLRGQTINHLYANIWNRNGLSLRDRRLITLALLAFQGHRDQLEDHIRGALLNCNPDEHLSEKALSELMVQVAHYGGWAAGTSGNSVLRKVLKNCKPCIEKSSPDNSIVFLDFDGTITAQETFEAMVRRFVPDMANEILPQIHSGAKSIKEGVEELFRLIKRSQYEAIENFYKQYSDIRGGFKGFLDCLQKKKIPIVILTGGLKDAVKWVFDCNNIKRFLDNIEIYGASVVPPIEAESSVEFIRVEGVEGRCENDRELVSKREIIEKKIKKQKFNEIIYIGDSKTDETAARFLIECTESPRYRPDCTLGSIDDATKTIVFARDSLAVNLTDGSYVPWKDFADILGCLKSRWYSRENQSSDSSC